MAVSTAVRLFNGYAQQLGVKPDYGRAVKGGSLMTTASAPVTLEEMRSRLANY